MPASIVENTTLARRHVPNAQCSEAQAMKARRRGRLPSMTWTHRSPGPSSPLRMPHRGVASADLGVR
ncbi:hypothetical protein BV20DRAFT_546409 [Pilatotrama ljubarskyi]|nr:hypothetical protein BV20DRAFT_546409 [Pilatotrama ljubarskyi]